MEIRIQLIIDGDERTRQEIAHWERDVLAPQTLGLKLEEAKALLAASQQALVTAQLDQYLAERTSCSACGRTYRRKGHHNIVIRSLFGTLRARSPRLRHCTCQEVTTGSFSPLAERLQSASCRNGCISKRSGPPLCPTA